MSSRLDDIIKYCDREMAKMSSSSSNPTIRRSSASSSRASSASASSASASSSSASSSSASVSRASVSSASATDSLTYEMEIKRRGVIFFERVFKPEEWFKLYSDCITLNMSKESYRHGSDYESDVNKIVNDFERKFSEKYFVLRERRWEAGIGYKYETSTVGYEYTECRTGIMLMTSRFFSRVGIKWIEMLEKVCKNLIYECMRYKIILMDDEFSRIKKYPIYSFENLVRGQCPQKCGMDPMILNKKEDNYLENVIGYVITKIQRITAEIIRDKSTSKIDKVKWMEWMEWMDSITYCSFRK